MEKFPFPDADDELKELSPILHQLKHRPRAQSDAMHRDYFSKLENQVLAKVQGQPSLLRRLQPYRMRLLWLSSVAVLVLGICLFWWASPFAPNEYEALRNSISREEIYDYFWENPDELELEWLALHEDEIQQFTREALAGDWQNDAPIDEELLNELSDSDLE